MIDALLYRYTGRRPCRLIKVNAKPYLERYYLGQLFGWTFYLHRFVSSDPERHLHNHPWRRGFSVVLLGGYDEDVVTDLAPRAPAGVLLFTRRVRWFNRVDGNHFHRIANAAPRTWTLFAHGPRQVITQACGEPVLKGWGFLEPAYLVGQHDVTVFRQHAPESEPEWWKSAPIGWLAGRVMRGGAR